MSTCPAGSPPGGEARRLLLALRAAYDDGGHGAVADLAEGAVRRGVVVPLLQQLHQESEEAAAAAEELLQALHSVAVHRLREAGWRLLGRGDTAGALRFVNVATGEEEDEPELPGTVPWETRLLQSLMMLAAPARFEGRPVWRCDVVHYRPCCGNGFLLDSEGCDHRALRTVVDIVVQDEGGNAARCRQLHAGVFRTPEAGAHADWNPSLPLGLTLDSWHEVTAAGLSLLLAAIGASHGAEPGVLVLGVGTGALPSFLRRYAPHVSVDVLEPVTERVQIARSCFGFPSRWSGAATVRRGGGRSRGGKLGRGSTRSARAPQRAGKRSLRLGRQRCGAVPRRFAQRSRRCRCRIVAGLPERGGGRRYAAVVVLGPPSWDGAADPGHDLPALSRLLTPSGALILHGDGASPPSRLRERLGSFWGPGSVAEITELDLLSPGADDAAPTILAAGPALPAFSTGEWYRHMQEPGGAFDPGAPNLDVAQRTSVIRVPGFLTSEEMAAIHKLAEQAQGNPSNVEIRSAPHSGAWTVVFLQSGGLFAALLPELRAKLVGLARSVGGRERWWDGEDADEQHFNVRVAEYHGQTAPSPGLPDPHHYDMDSLVTVDILLSAPGAEFTGGEFLTLEGDGSLRTHAFGRGDAIVFCSHKFHCVRPVTSGCRRALVVEFWRGPERACPHRCRCLQQACPEEGATGPPPAGRRARSALLLPFRLGSVEERHGTARASPERGVDAVHGNQRQLRLLWQTNDVGGGLPQPPTQELACVSMAAALG